MDNTAQLRYGKGTVEVPITGAAQIDYLYENKMPVIEDVKTTFLKSLEEGTIESPGLSKLINGQDKVTIVISDMTRRWQHQDRLTHYLVDYLHDELGVAYENMDVVVAVGTHRKAPVEEFPLLASPEVCAKVRVQNHDCDADDMVYIGDTSRGTQVWVNPLVVGRKVIILSGTVHHVMAGFGGGRKSVVPGVASRETIRQNHTLALDPQLPKSADTVGCGRVAFNPINEDMNEAAELLHPTFGISIVVDADTRHSGFFCGDMMAAWRTSCDYQRKCYEVPIDHLADIVITSCGGNPRDLNLYQSTKTIFNTNSAMKPGGTMILLTECTEGAGSSDFFDWAGPLKRGTLDPDLRKAFTIGGYIFYAACEHIRKGHTLMLSTMDPDLVRDMSIDSYSDIRELLKNVDFTGKTVYVIPSGGSVLPVLQA